MYIELAAFDNDHRLGGNATHPLARPAGRLALSLLLAGMALRSVVRGAPRSGDRTAEEMPVTAMWSACIPLRGRIPKGAPALPFAVALRRRRFAPATRLNAPSGASNYGF